MAAFGAIRKMALFLLLAVFAMSFASLLTKAPQAFADDSDMVALVEDSDGATRSFNDFDKAWDYAKEKGGTMYLLKDWTTSYALTVEAGIKATIDLQGHMINRNNVDPSKPDHASDSGNSGSVFILKKNAQLSLTSDVSTIAHNGDLLSGGRFWHYSKDGDTPIYGALVTGGATDSKLGGGGMALEENAKLVMSNVTVAGNIADRYGVSYGYGGAISLYGEKSSAELSDCGLMYNYAQSGGGAVSVYDHYCSFEMSGGCVSNNRTDNYGGGIYIDNTELQDFGDGAASVSLSTAQVSNNYADEDGGGIYLGGLGVVLSGGEISGNSAAQSGGGIYVKQEDCGLDGCTVTNNEAGKRGGGVLVENDNVITTPALYLTGAIVIKDNKANNAKSNLFLRNSYALSRSAKIYGVPNSSSEIWVSAEEDGVISSKADSYNDAVFFADDDSKVVYWETNSSDGNYRFLKIGNTSEGHSKSGYVATQVELKASEVSTGEGELQKTSYDYNGYPVYKGYSMEDRTYLLNAYYYSDGYFMEPATNYNEHLASFAFHLTCSAMNSSVFTDSRGNSRDYKLQASHAKQMLSDIGVAEEDIFLSPTFFEKPTSDSIACSIGSKQLKNADGGESGITLVAIGVRGQGYASEWASNVTLGGATLDGVDEDAEHSGFANAADTIMLSWLEPYLEERGLDQKAKQGKVRFLVTGFSRAGAVSNLLAKRLIDRYEFQSMVGDNHVVFGYTFEAPQGGTYNRTMEGRSYNGIHNAILSGDLVPFVAMTSMGFQRYGVDHYLGGTAAGTASTDVITGEGAESEGQAKRYSRKYAGWLTHPITLAPDESGFASKIVENPDDWKSTHFMKDNDYYVIGSEEYKQSKDAMLKQLAACNSTVFFDDYFHLATLTTENHDFTEEVGSDDVTLAQFLDDFMFYVNAWLINENNLQERPARLHYITNFQYGDSYSSYEETARTLMVALFTGKLNASGVAEKLSSSDAKWDLVKWVFHSGYDGTSDELIGILTKYGVFGDDGIPLSQAQATALARMLLNVVAGDLDDVSDYMAGTSVDYDADSESLVMFGTLKYNLSRIMLNHKPDVVCAWLRSVDSYYTSDEEISTTLYNVASATSDEIGKPYLTMKVNGKEVTVKAGESCNLFAYDYEKQPSVTDIQLHTEDRNAGGLVFYTDGDGSGVEYKDYDYYDINSSSLFDGVSDWSDKQKLTAHTVWYNTPSEDASFTIYYERDSNVNAVYVNDELFGMFQKDAKVVVPIEPEDEYHEYSSCTLVNSSAPYIPDGHWWDVSDKGTLEFTMPGGDVYWRVDYQQKKIADPVASPDATSFETDQYMEFSTPSGTEDEGFTISHSYYAYTVDGLPDKKEASGTGASGVRVYALDGRETVWRIDVTAKHDGWIESSKLFIIHVTPAKKSYMVEVLNGTLVEDGKATEKTTAAFKVGDTVTVTASQESVDGWKSDPAGLVRSDCKDRTVSFTMPSKDVAIAAILPASDCHLVTFDSAGGSPVSPQMVESGGVAIEPEAPVLEGFTFEGWLLEDGTAYDFSTPVTDDLTLYAEWFASGEPSHTDGDSSQADGDSGKEEADGSGESGVGNGNGDGNGIPDTGDDATAPVALFIAAFAFLAVSVLLRRRRVGRPAA